MRKTKLQRLMQEPSERAFPANRTPQPCHWLWSPLVSTRGPLQLAQNDPQQCKGLQINYRNQKRYPIRLPLASSIRQFLFKAAVRESLVSFPTHPPVPYLKNMGTKSFYQKNLPSTSAHTEHEYQKQLFPHGLESLWILYRLTLHSRKFTAGNYSPQHPFTINQTA